ncbi:MAG: hypothetical protein ABI547_10440 [Betaproteobacteria bacterium]
MNCVRFAGISVVAVLGLAGSLHAADRTDFTNLAQSRYVHCAFYKGYETDPATGGPIMVEGKSDSLVYFQNVDVARAKARAIYTRMSGSHEVTVIQTDKALHFIENVAGMYMMTSVHSCLEYDEKRGACVMYGAVNSRIFDTAVLSDPDRIYEKIKNDADPGFCDYSFIGIQEAARRPR